MQGGSGGQAMPSHAAAGHFPLPTCWPGGAMAPVMMLTTNALRGSRASGGMWAAAMPKGKGPAASQSTPLGKHTAGSTPSKRLRCHA